MIQKFKKLTEIAFIRNTGFLQAGKILSIFLAVASSVILARVLKPELYGLYGLIFAFTGLVGTFLGWGGSFASLTLLSASYIKEQRREIKDILTYFLKISLLPIALIGVPALVLSPFLTELLYKNSEVGIWARIVLLGIFAAVAFNLLVIVLQVVRQIKFLTIFETLERLAYTVFPVLFVLAGWGLAGLSWGYLAAALLFLVVSVWLYARLSRKDRLWPSLREVFVNFKATKISQYFKFGFLIAFDKNLSNLLSLLPVIFLGILAAPAEVGYFKIAFAYITIPLMVLGPVSRLLTVQLPQSDIYGPHIFKKHFYRTTFYSGLISVLSIVPLIVLAPFLVKIFYGPEYAPSVPLVYQLAALTAFSGFAVGFSPFYRTVKKVGISIAVNFCQAVSFVLLVLILDKLQPSLLAVIWSLVFVNIFYLVVHFLIIKKILSKIGLEKTQQ